MIPWTLIVKDWSKINRFSSNVTEALGVAVVAKKVRLPSSTLIRGPEVQNVPGQAWTQLQADEQNRWNQHGG